MMAAILLALMLSAPPTVADEALADVRPVAHRYTGALQVDAGTVRFRVRGPRISHATATVFGQSFTLRASDLVDGEFQLTGNRGKDYIRIKGRLRRDGRWVSGTWTGAIAKKRKEGRFTATRR